MASVAYGQGKTAPPQGSPPKNLTKKADGHFTANQDPANPEKFEVYTVKMGDTLSAIAGQTLKSAKLWPQLWEQNEHIVNPHWIYPNDKILIRPITLITEATPPDPEPDPETPPAPQVQILPQQPPAAAPEQKHADVFELAKPKPVPEIKASDLYCSGFIRTTPVPKSNKVIAKFNADRSALAAEANYIYLSQGTEDGISVGNVFQVVRPTRHINDPPNAPKKEHDLGMHYLDVAQVRVVMTQPNFAMARVVNSCEAIEVGDFMLPFERAEIPSVPRPRQYSPTMSVTGDIKGSVVMTRDVLSNFGSTFRASGKIPGVRTGTLGRLDRGVAAEGTIVYVDIGTRDGVNAGDVFVVYRPVELDGQLYALPKESKKLEDHQTAVGELVILKVEERASTALVTYAMAGVSAGDSVERR